MGPAMYFRQTLTDIFSVARTASVGLGMPILDNLDLDAAADEARRRDRWTFLFVGAPLRVEGGTGSPLNPIAVF